MLVRKFGPSMVMSKRFYRILHDRMLAIMSQNTPHSKLVQAKDDMLAISSGEELILKVESNIIRDSASLIISQRCDLQVSRLNGCYNCPHGAKFTVNCSSSTRAVVMVTYDSHTFAIRCNSSEESNWVLLNFEKANVYEKCAVHFENPEHIILEGTLLDYNSSQT